MEKKQKNKLLKKTKDDKESNKLKNKKTKNPEILEIKEDEEEEEEEEIFSDFDIEVEDEDKKKEKNEGNEENEEDEEDEEEDKKEMKAFTIQLLIHTKVMDNREEIKKCICHNYLFLDDQEKGGNNGQNIDLNEYDNIYIEKEIIPSIEVPILRESNNNQLSRLNNIESSDIFCIKLKDLTKALQKLGFPLSGSMVNIFVNYTNNYVYFGTEPLDDSKILYSYMLEPNKEVIKMKIINYIQKRMLDGYSNSIINTYFRKPIHKVKHNLEITKFFTPSMTNLEYYAEESGDVESSSSLSSLSYENKDESNDIPINKDNNDNKKKFGKLTDSHKRERKIGYIIEKVYAWRKLYNGFKDENDNYNRYSLDKAAELVGVSKKSLDDYLLQIRLGRKYGFNFNENKYKKIGVLRESVKTAKETEPGIIKKKINKGKKKGLENNKKDNLKEKKKEDNNEIKKTTNSLFAGLNLFGEEKNNNFINKKRRQTKK
jgi:hypothetical protein